MPLPTFTGLRPKPEFGDIVRKMNELADELTNLMLNLDSINVVSLDAGTIIVYDLDGGPGTITLTKDGMTINDGTRDTFKVDINGNVTMTGALVRSSTEYPKVELNSIDNLIGAFQTALNSIRIVPTNGPTTPAILFDQGGVTGGQIQLGSVGSFGITTGNENDISLQSANNVNVSSVNNINLSPLGQLKINDLTCYSGTIPIIISVDFTTESVTMRHLVFTKGLLTNIL